MSAEQRFDIIDVVRVVPKGGYRLAITFSDGSKRSPDYGTAASRSRNPGRRLLSTEAVPG
jgi:hypothetical protein